MRIHAVRFAALAGALTAAMMSVVQAQTVNWPDRPVKLIVPFPAGGPNDIIGRVVGQKLQSLLGQPFVIDTRGGAGGVTGTDVVAKAAPDGYTIAITSAGALAIAASIQKVPYHSTRDLAPVTLIASVPELLVVPEALNVKSVAELVALAKARPQGLNFASTGRGSLPHLAAELYKVVTASNMVHVPYSGAAPAVQDLLAGRVDLLFADITVLLEHVKAGKLRALGVGSKVRSPIMPDVPTFAEQGIPRVEAENWYGMVATPGTPAAILGKLHAATLEALKSDEVRSKLLPLGATLSGNSSAEFAAYITAESGKWADVVKKAGISVE